MNTKSQHTTCVLGTVHKEVFPEMIVLIYVLSASCQQDDNICGRCTVIYK